MVVSIVADINSPKKDAPLHVPFPLVETNRGTQPSETTEARWKKARHNNMRCDGVLDVIVHIKERADVNGKKGGLGLVSVCGSLSNPTLGSR